MTLLSESSGLTVTTDDPNGEVATRLIHDLCSELSVRYGTPPSPFFPDEALAPGTAFVVARVGGQPIGCGALRRIDETTAEVKRMYVAPDGRRRGIARRILHALEELAAGFNYRTIRLQTGSNSRRLLAFMSLAAIIVPLHTVITSVILAAFVLRRLSMINPVAPNKTMQPTAGPAR